MSKTRLRELRRTVRNTLGTSRDPAPELGQVLRSARAIEEMLSLTSGRYKLKVWDGELAEHRPVADVVSEYISKVNEYERQRHEERMAELRRQREGQG